MFGNMEKTTIFLLKKAISKKLILFDRKLKIYYNQELIILSQKIAYNDKQHFGVYNYKQKIIISELLYFYQIDHKY